MCVQNIYWMFNLRKIGTKEGGSSRNSNDIVSERLFCRSVFFIRSPHSPVRCPQGHSEMSKVHSEIRAEGQEVPGSSLLCHKVGGWPWASLGLPGLSLSICKMKGMPGLSSILPPQPESSELSSFIFPLHKRGKCVSKHCLFVEKCFLSWVCELSAEYKPVHLTEYL